MKRFLIVISFLSLCFLCSAEDNSSIPRYKGFAAGGDILSQFAIGDYSKFAIMNLGASLTGEYTIPLELPKNMDLGLAVRADFAHVFVKSGQRLKSDEEIRAFGAVWLRIPFILGNQFFAFQPELGGGLSVFLSNYESGGQIKSGTYLSPLISIAPSFRWIPPKLQQLEVEAAPLFTLVPENSKATTLLGLRLGAIWHFQMKNDTSTEEKKKAKLEKAEEKRQKKEAERLAAEDEKRKKEEERLAAEEDKRRKKEEEKARLEEEKSRQEEEKARLEEEAEKQRLAEEAEKARKAEEERRRREEEAERARLAEEEKRRAEEEAERARLEEAERKRKAEEEAERARLAEEEKRRTEEEAERARLEEERRLAEEAEKARLEEEAARLAAEEAEKARLAEEAEKERLAEEEKRLAEENTETEAEIPSEPDQPKVITERLTLRKILYFSKNGAVFTGLSHEQIRQNEKTIDEAVELIKKHPDCTVLIEGYANNISGTEKEDRTACMPLSLWRAEYIKKELIKRGIKAENIETVGRGGAAPLASRKERNNWWKNRRVEFVITY